LSDTGYAIVDVIGIVAVIAALFIGLNRDEKKQTPMPTQDKWYVGERVVPDSDWIAVYPTRSGGWSELEGWPIYVRPPGRIAKFFGVTIESKVARAKRAAQRAVDRQNRSDAKYLADEAEAERVVGKSEVK
jgi:hypothetical protein